MLRASQDRPRNDYQFGVMKDAAAEPRHGGMTVFRHASRDDVPAIVRMLADDALGAKREAFVSPLPESYYLAFEAIDRDPNNELVVAELGGRIIGVLQMTFIPYMTYRGSWRALIEGVRVDSGVRSSGVGRQLLTWAVDRARQRGCHLVQLTSDKARRDAIRFYESLGFVASHEGMKLHLDHSPAAPK
jgi:GNAT superfamily N-acetyltransferase